jgi:hypothetical protein
VDHNRRVNREGFQNDVTECLGKERGDHDGPGALEQASELVSAEKAFKVDVFKFQRTDLVFKFILKWPCAGDSQVDLREILEERNQVLEALHADEPTCGGEVGTLELGCR